MTEAILIRAETRVRRPRLGFLGVGWIGRDRMAGVLAAGAADCVAIADPASEALAAAAELAPGAALGSSLDELLAQDLDGLVIATPSAGHAREAIRALEAGVAVFCQKPLGRSAAEVSAVVAAARRADRLLGADFSYREARAMVAARELVRSGALGNVFAADLVFHNAYGPDKPWFYDLSRSGGGCVMDLGVHLVDLALWCLDFPEVERVTSTLFAGGRRLPAGGRAVEDYAAATLELAGGAIVRIACSWRLNMGRDAEISAAFYGEAGAVAAHNVDGSFYDFVAHHHRGTACERLVEPPDAWGPRSAVSWASALGRGARYDPAAAHYVEVARVLDRIYDP